MLWGDVAPSRPKPPLPRLQPAVYATVGGPLAPPPTTIEWDDDDASLPPRPSSARYVLQSAVGDGDALTRGGPQCVPCISVGSVYVVSDSTR